MVCCRSSILYVNVHAAGEVASIFDNACERQLALKRRVSAARSEPASRAWGITAAWLWLEGGQYLLYTVTIEST